MIGWPDRVAGTEHRFLSCETVYGFVFLRYDALQACDVMCPSVLLILKIIKYRNEPVPQGRHIAQPSHRSR
jgi:hypothetical protein